MNEIKCPHCGKVFQVDETSYAAILQQVRDERFYEELHEREESLRVQQEQAVELAVSKEAARAQKAQADADARARKRLDDVRERAARDAQAAREARAKAEAERDELRARLDAQAQALEAQAKLAVNEAVAEVTRERDKLANQVELVKSQKSQAEASLREEMTQQLAARDQIIKYKDDEIERIHQMRSKTTIKLLGESLEQHCQASFDQVRAMAFPNAYFEKDNEVVGGTKGDFVFRDFDEDGVEFISIMFEMKTEEETSTRRKRNEEHFKKLDEDRTKKGCEYAVLVSMLEPDSELYNAGIVDVSHRYPKMYVVRPQFFIPIISLLRNAALQSLDARRELEQMRQQNIDVTNFEEKMEKFKESFGKNYAAASKKFGVAIDQIDKAIADLQKVKENLVSSENQLRLANKKAEELSIRKLTYRNPTMKAAFEEAREAAAGELPSVEAADEVGEDPDSIE